MTDRVQIGPPFDTFQWERGLHAQGIFVYCSVHCQINGLFSHKTSKRKLDAYLLLNMTKTDVPNFLFQAILTTWKRYLLPCMVQSQFHAKKMQAEFLLTYASYLALKMTRGAEISDRRTHFLQSVERKTACFSPVRRFSSFHSTYKAILYEAKGNAFSFSATALEWRS